MGPMAPLILWGPLSKGGDQGASKQRRANGGRVCHLLPHIAFFRPLLRLSWPDQAWSFLIPWAFSPFGVEGALFGPRAKKFKKQDD